jgi:hypothetical protein
MRWLSLFLACQQTFMNFWHASKPSWMRRSELARSSSGSFIPQVQDHWAKVLVFFLILFMEFVEDACIKLILEFMGDEWYHFFWWRNLIISVHIHIATNIFTVLFKIQLGPVAMTKLIVVLHCWYDCVQKVPSLNLDQALTDLTSFLWFSSVPLLR